MLADRGAKQTSKRGFSRRWPDSRFTVPHATRARRCPTVGAHFTTRRADCAYDGCVSDRQARSPDRLPGRARSGRRAHRANLGEDDGDGRTKVSRKTGAARGRHDGIVRRVSDVGADAYRSRDSRAVRGRTGRLPSRPLGRRPGGVPEGSGCSGRRGTARCARLRFRTVPRKRVDALHSASTGGP